MGEWLGWIKFRTQIKTFIVSSSRSSWVTARQVSQTALKMLHFKHWSNCWIDQSNLQYCSQECFQNHPYLFYKMEWNMFINVTKENLKSYHNYRFFCLFFTNIEWVILTLFHFVLILAQWPHIVKQHCLYALLHDIKCWSLYILFCYQYGNQYGW